MSSPIEAVAPVADDASDRRQAVHGQGSYIVRAPAGSGKTTLLVQRFLRLLAEAEQPESLLALTFSRKAAAEMRNRVLGALADEPKASPDATRQLAAVARARDAACGWNLAQTPQRLQIMTLDGLAQRLVQRMPWLSRFGPAPQPTDDPSPLYRAAARATLALIETPAAPGAASARLLLQHLHADLDAAESLLAELLERRDQWLPLDRASRQQLESALGAAVLDALIECRAALAPATPMIGELPPATLAALPIWRDLGKVVLRKDGTPLAKWAKLGLGDEACRELDRARSLPDPAFSAPQWELIAALFELLPLAAARLRLAELDAGVCDYPAITAAAAAALGDVHGGDPSALAFALDARLQHVFVDEFQDTSHAQHELLHRLLGDWQAGDGRSLFLVGDPWQSVYGWRNADVSLFLQCLRQRRWGGLPLTPLLLRRNHRSHELLIRFCNEVFTRAAPGRDQPLTTSVSFSTAVPTPASLGDAAPHVEFHALPARQRHLEGERVAELAQQELQAAPSAEVAILVYHRSHLNAILPALAARDIEFRGVKLLALDEHPAALDLLALTRALFRPADRIAWLAVLRAPWCGLTLNQLHALVQDAPAAPVPDLISAAERLARLEPAARARLAPVAAILRKAGAQARRQPPRALIEWTWQALDGSGIHGPGAELVARAFFSQLEAASRGGGVDFDGLGRTLASQRAPSASAATARLLIMTIHEAKGLEFDAVIVPGLDRRPRNEPRQLLRWIRAGRDQQTSFFLAPRPLTNAPDPLYDFVGGLLRRRREQEQLRLFYVALTRARRRLHVVAAAPLRLLPEASTPLRRVWSYFAPFFAAPAVPAAAPPLPAAPIYSGLRRRAEILPWTGGDIGEEQDAVAPAPIPDASTRAAGIAVHAALQRAAELGQTDPDLPWLRRRLQQLGLAGAPLQAAEAVANQALRLIAADERGRWILAPHPAARCEWEISGMVNGQFVHARVDRTFVDDDGTRWVIDYKTTADDGAGSDRAAFLRRESDRHRTQLDQYRALVAALDPGRPLRCALYFPLLPAFVEVPF